MDNLFLDSSIFIRYNYLEGGTIKSILNLSKHNMINVFITEVVYEEVLSNFNKSFQELQASLKKKPYTILANTNYNEDYNRLKSTSSVPKVFKNVFDKAIKDNKVKVVENSYADIDEIMLSYFERTPPFSEKKKTEFPDAVSLSALKKYFFKAKVYCTVYSTDKDLANYNADYILLGDIDKLDSYISEKHKELDHITIEFIKQFEIILKGNESDIKQKTNHFLDDVQYDYGSLSTKTKVVPSFHDFLNYYIQEIHYEVIYTEGSKYFINIKTKGTFAIDLHVANPIKHDSEEHYTTYECIIYNFELSFQSSVIVIELENKKIDIEIVSVNDSQELVFWDAEDIKVIRQK
ncbi:DUF4935 domain-containing protein [Sphingobacterium shayense]|uniref:PIN domain-containing protein n=1 Tax=Sphingobacterium shayense TaxID=626343 RepID=UPI001553BD4F|nr:PIN domain-containing protein [Sphingobacterium shayense]NQD71984.1 DUF4935 domain-containing protein [Sphingobacterium shayense]